jgi:hypothetical protein
VPVKGELRVDTLEGHEGRFDGNDFFEVRLHCPEYNHIHPLHG